MEPLPSSEATPLPLPSPAAARYHARALRFREEEAREAERSRRLSWARLAVFLALVAALLVAERGSPPLSALGLAAAGLLGIAFVALLAVHRRVRTRERHAAALAAVNEEGGLRLQRRWSDLPDEPWGTPPAEYPEAEDLNLVGRASLLRLLAPPPTVPGRDRLTAWLLDAAPAGIIGERQEAVRALAPLVDFRDEWGARGRPRRPGRTGEVQRFLEWAEGDRWLEGRVGLRRAAWILPLVTGALGWLHVAGLAAPFWILSLGATVVVASRCTRAIHRRYDEAMAGESGVRQYDSLLELLAELPAAAPRLNHLRREIEVPEGPSAHEAVARLRRILDLAETRRSMLGPGLQLALLWDVHVLGSLERWQDRHGADVRRWLGAMGEVEALVALARLADDHPDWAFPEVSDDPGPRPVVEAVALGHPLLPPDRCVRNDVTVGPPGTVLVVTGSNMSGKSTLLRAVGANASLAGAGGPVCARSMRLPPLRLATCMRVQDALDEGVSLFMAELRRLKEVVDRARATPGTGRVLLYLLDEMLQGTNTAERQVAARKVLSHLVRSGAIGAVTTHDLALADAGVEGEAVHVHFRETVEPGPRGTVLHFDHHLRPGPATSRNALRLLEAVGLGGGDEGPGPGPGPGPVATPDSGGEGLGAGA